MGPRFGHQFDVMAVLEDAGAVYVGRHFVYKSSKHGSGYINMDPIYTKPVVMQKIVRRLLDPFVDEPFLTIAGPAVGGVALAAYAGLVAASEYPYMSTRVIWADKDGDEFRFERAGFASLLDGNRILVVEDLLTTGGSVIKVCKEVERYGGEVIGVSAIVNRGGVTAEDLGVPRLEALARVNFEAVDAGDCELCAQGVGIVTNIGHGAKFAEDHPDYAGDFYALQV